VAAALVGRLGGERRHLERAAVAVDRDEGEVARVGVRRRPVVSSSASTRTPTSIDVRPT
jgi:hypothetical protein